MSSVVPLQEQMERKVLITNVGDLLLPWQQMVATQVTSVVEVINSYARNPRFTHELSSEDKGKDPSTGA